MKEIDVTENTASKQIRDLTSVKPQEMLENLHGIGEKVIAELQDVEVNNASDFDNAKALVTTANKSLSDMKKDRMNVTRLLDGVKKDFMAPEKALGDAINKVKVQLNSYFSTVAGDVDTPVSYPAESVSWVNLLVHVHNFELSIIDWIPDSMVDSVKFSVKTGRQDIAMSDEFGLKVGDFYSNLQNSYQGVARKDLNSLKKSLFSEKLMAERVSTYVANVTLNILGSTEDVKNLLGALSGMDAIKRIGYYTQIKENTKKFLDGSIFIQELADLLSQETKKDDQEIIDLGFGNLVSQKAGLILTNSVKENFIPSVENREGLMNAINWFLDNNEDGVKTVFESLPFIFDEIQKGNVQLDGVKFKREHILKV